MPEESKDASGIDDPVTYMLSVAIELHEMRSALRNAGFTDKESLYLVGQAVANGVMLPIQDFGPDDEFNPVISLGDEEDDDFDEDDGDLA